MLYLNAKNGYTRFKGSKPRQDMFYYHKLWKEKRNMICHEVGAYRKVNAADFDRDSRIYYEWLRIAYEGITKQRYPEVIGGITYRSVAP